MWLESFLNSESWRSRMTAGSTVRRMGGTALLERLTELIKRTPQTFGWARTTWLSPRVLGLVVEWASAHQIELREDWELARALSPLKRIEPLR
jgi:hypothetical protein